MTGAACRAGAALLVTALLLAGCAGAPEETPGTAPGTMSETTPGTAASVGPASQDPSPKTEATDTPATRVLEATPALEAGERAWVAVSVATLWRSPDSPRVVDEPALTRPVHIVKWLADMTLEQRRALSGRADSQALLGDRVRVVRLKRGWAKVAVPSQPTPSDSRGYLGWVPRRQLTATPPAVSARRATVTARTVWLRTDRVDGDRVFRISYGTRLAVVGLTRRFVRVATPLGATRRVKKSAVVVHKAGAPALQPVARSLVSNARSFVGLAYLWAGVSGFGVDCSGLTWLVHRVHGVEIPRDAAPQSQGGRAVTTLRRGDLLFYATSGTVHHVSMYVGDGKMVHSPGTGESVEVISTATQPYEDEYAGARRYVP